MPNKMFLKLFLHMKVTTVHPYKTLNMVKDHGHFPWKCSRDLRRWRAEWTCIMDMQRGTCNENMQHGQSAWTCSMNTQRGLAANEPAAWRYSADMQHADATWRYGHETRTSLGMQHGHGAWACSMDMQSGPAAWTYIVDMQQGHAAVTCIMDI